MATQGADLDVLKDIPGYKAILKAVLKSQIQLLVEQLSDQTGEESIILTASINDGTLSHLGSHTGKGFLDGRDEIKSQFLGFCLKSHHRLKATEQMYPPPRSDVIQASPATPIHQFQPAPKRPRVMPPPVPVSMMRSDNMPADPRPRLTSSDLPVPPIPPTPPSQAFTPNIDNRPDPMAIKLEKHNIQDDQDSFHDHGDDTTGARLPTAVQMDPISTSTHSGNNDLDQNDRPSVSNITVSSESSQDSAKIIKSEPGSENEVDLEITNVEIGRTPPAGGVADNWGQGQAMPGGRMPFGSPSAEETDPSVMDDQSSYNFSSEQQGIDPTFQNYLYDVDYITDSAKQESKPDSAPDSLDAARKRQLEVDPFGLFGTGMQDKGEFLDKKDMNGASQAGGGTGRSTPSSKGQSINSQSMEPTQCKLCFKWLYNADNMAYHAQTHIGDEPGMAPMVYNCEKCSKIFKYKANFMNHQQTCQGETPSRRKRGKQSKMEDTKLATEPEGGSQGPDSNDGPGTPQQTSSNAEHGDSPIDPDMQGEMYGDPESRAMQFKNSPGKPAKKEQCVLCTKWFSSKYSLQGHMRRHLGEKPFQCEGCSRKFTYQQGLVYHQKVCRAFGGEMPPTDMP